METIEALLGLNAKRARKLKKLSQEALAESCGLSVFAVQSLEAGRAWPEMNTLVKVSECLGIPLIELFQKRPADDALEAALSVVADKLGYEILKKN